MVARSRVTIWTKPRKERRDDLGVWEQPGPESSAGESGRSRLADRCLGAASIPVVLEVLPMTSAPANAPLGPRTAVPFQLFRGLSYLVLLLMLASCVYAAVIVIQNWNVISV